MRTILFSALLLTLLYGCKKNNDGTCRVNSVQLFTNGSMVGSYNYEYDDRGRIKKSTHTSSTVTYEYYTDSVVAVTADASGMGFSRTTYYLNGAGLAHSSKVVLNPNPNGLQFDYTYTYDGDNYLIGQRVIFSQVYSGSILKDTSYTNFTVVNGNVTKRTETNGDELNYEYSSAVLTDNIIALNPFPSNDGPHLGKPPINLISKVKDAGGNVLDNISYSFGLGGKKVTELVKSNPSVPGTINKTQLQYTCN